MWILVFSWCCGCWFWIWFSDMSFQCPKFLNSAFRELSDNLERWATGTLQSSDNACPMNVHQNVRSAGNPVTSQSERLFVDHHTYENVGSLRTTELVHTRSRSPVRNEFASTDCTPDHYRFSFASSFASSSVAAPMTYADDSSAHRSPINFEHMQSAVIEFQIQLYLLASLFYLSKLESILKLLLHVQFHIWIWTVLLTLVCPSVLLIDWTTWHRTLWNIELYRNFFRNTFVSKHASVWISYHTLSWHGSLLVPLRAYPL